MKSFLLGSLGALAILLAAYSGAVWARQPANHYELYSSGSPWPFTFVLDRRTGRIWEFWVNTTTHQSGMTELVYNNPPAEVKAEIDRQLKALDFRPATPAPIAR